MNDTLNREEIEAALRRLGELADQAGLALKLQLTGLTLPNPKSANSGLRL